MLSLFLLAISIAQALLVSSSGVVDIKTLPQLSGFLQTRAGGLHNHLYRRATDIAPISISLDRR